ncbi:MAG: DUF3307 domain-containing protein [Pseudomonadota bacterium]
MSELLFPVVLLMCLLQVKHMLADFFFQTRIMLSGRAAYVHFGRFLHVLLHAVFSLFVFLLLGTGIGLALLIVVVEMIVHFHIDYAKSRYTLGRDLTPAQPNYWRAMGIDQALHQLTYVAMVAFWFIQTAGS